MSPRTRTVLAVACGCALALAAGAVPSSLAAAPTVRLGFAPRVPSGTSVLGAMSGSSRMQVAVALRPSNEAALEAFATEVSAPGSILYGDYITPSQFASRFGASSAQITSVEASLRAHGLSPGPVSANHLSIPISATVSQLQQAFSVALVRVRLPGAATAVLNTVAPLLDANIAGVVQGIVGLNTLAAPKPLDQRSALLRPSSSTEHATEHVVTGGPQPCAAARSAAPGQSAYTADQIASAYGFSDLYRAGDEGAGETVALYELEPFDPSDIAAYQSCYGTGASISKVNVDGGAGSGPGQGEAALDIEQVIGLAPKAKILVYEGPNSNSGAPGAGPYDTWNVLISQDRARVISASWGQCESLEGATDAAAEASLFEEAAAQGQTVVSASGDNGSEDCYNPNQLLPDTSLAVDDPSSQRFVTGVGGTTLTALGPRPSEHVWNDGGSPLGGLLGIQPGAGGGGVSSFWGMPSYQANAPSVLHVNRSHARESPDVSADADPNSGYLIYWNGSGSMGDTPSGWQGIGGTSGAAPLWAALFALTNASAACSGAQVGFANPKLYDAAASGYGQDFNDVTSGNNDFTGTNGGRYSAGTGYDLASGLGTPNAGSLVPALCTHAGRVGPPTVSDVSVSGVRRGKPTLRVTIRSGSDAPALKRVTIRLPSGLHFAGHRHVVVSGPQGGRAGFSSSVSHGVLTINLKSTKTQIRITISYSTIKATRHESAAVRTGRAGKLQIVVTVTDAHRHRTRLSASVRPRN